MAILFLILPLKFLARLDLLGSANIGLDYAMFEAIHGSAPDIAGKDIANPSGLINASIMMLNHIGQNENSKFNSKCAF